MLTRNETFIVCTRFSVRDCKRNERGDSNHTIYFEWPYWKLSCSLLGMIQCRKPENSNLTVGLYYQLHCLTTSLYTCDGMVKICKRVTTKSFSTDDFIIFYMLYEYLWPWCLLNIMPKVLFNKSHAHWKRSSRKLIKCYN